jgi:hypothetical protein
LDEHPGIDAIRFALSGATALAIYEQLLRD